jgi:hypothetical protein
VPTIVFAGRVAPFGKKISWPMNFPPLFSHILGGNLLEEYITSYWSIVVTKFSPLPTQRLMAKYFSEVLNLAFLDAFYLLNPFSGFGAV